MADSKGEFQFTEADKKFIEYANKQLALRQQKIAQMKRKNIAVFGFLLASVAGIYTYTMFATKQEKLDFDE